MWCGTTNETLIALTRLARGDTLTLDEIQALPEIADAYARIGDVEEQIEQNAPSWESETPKAIKKLSTLGSAVKNEKGKYEYTGEVRSDKRVDIVIGPPAAGKSSVLADPLSEKYRSRIIDSDMAKEMLSGYRDGLGAGVVHEESGKIKREVIKQCLSNGDNIVLPIIGDKIDKLTAQVEKFKALGYDVHLHLNELPSGKAIGRAINRYLNQGRFIDPRFLFGYGDKPSAVYDQITRKERLLDGHSKYSNDVDFGQEPIFLGGTEDLSVNKGADGSRRRLDSGSFERNFGKAQEVEHSIDEPSTLPDDDFLRAEIDAWRSNPNYSVDDNTGKRQFANQAIQNNQYIPDYIKQAFLNDPAKSDYSRESNMRQLNEAWSRVNSEGYEGAVNRLVNQETKFTTEDNADALILMQQALHDGDLDTRTRRWITRQTRVSSTGL